MDQLSYHWTANETTCSFDLTFVKGTSGQPYTFGETSNTREVEIHDFFIGTTPISQAFWIHVMGSNPSIRQSLDLPAENVSWDELTGSGGFLDRINESPILASVVSQSGLSDGRFRLPSDTEWEYAARGGVNWTDQFHYSGSNDVDSVAWHDRKHGDHTQPIGLKAPNQLGLYDMSGNVWEWCQDTLTSDLENIPTDGSAYAGEGEQKVLRGGCFHNWAMHCTVSKRYGIEPDYKDGCIGFRLVFADAG
jgi:formylglycine-generating enzyme required for sulfatase activity